MAQAIITGLTGSVTLPQDQDGNGLNQYIASLTISTGSELLDISHYAGAGWRTRAAGLKDLSGQCVAFMTKGTTGTNPFNLDTDVVGGSQNATMTVSFDTGCYIAFKAIIGNVQVVGEYQGLNIITFNYSKADDLSPTIVWVTS